MDNQQENLVQFEDRETLEHEAREWLVRLDGDEPLTEPEKQALRTWMARSPAHHRELVRIAEFWDSSNVLTELLIPMQQVASVAGRRRGQHSWGFLLGSLLSPRRTAALAVSLCLVWVAFSALVAVPLDASNGIYASAIGELREETLADGSVLQINTDSQVRVEFSEQVRKIRLLRGEAHFQVAHNQDWPFEVYAGKGRVKAVGTAFLVRLEAEQLNVIVTDGRVDLALNRDAASAALPDNQSPASAPLLHTLGQLKQGEGALLDATASAESYQVLAQKDMARQLSWREGYLVFEGESLSVVVAELNRYLPLRVEIVDQALREIPIGGRFKVGELEALFDVLEASFNIRVARLDDQHIQLFARPDASQP